MQQVNSPTQTNSCPIFIGGEGRSGTTLLSLMLNSHSQIAHGPELHFRGPVNLGDYILSILDKKTKPDNDQWESYRHNDETYAGFHFVNRCHRCGIDEHLLRNLINETMRKTNTNIEKKRRHGIVSDFCGEPGPISKLNSVVQPTKVVSWIPGL